MRRRTSTSGVWSWPSRWLFARGCRGWVRGGHRFRCNSDTASRPFWFVFWDYLCCDIVLLSGQSPSSLRHILVVKTLWITLCHLQKIWVILKIDYYSPIHIKCVCKVLIFNFQNGSILRFKKARLAKNELKNPSKQIENLSKKNLVNVNFCRNFLFLEL